MNNIEMQDLLQIRLRELQKGYPETQVLCQLMKEIAERIAELAKGEWK